MDESREGRTLTVTIDSALIGIGILMVQAHLANVQIGGSAFISVIAFAIAIPLHSALLLLSQHENYYQQLSRSWVVSLARSTSKVASVVGVAAGFWQISWIPGIAVVASGLIAGLVHTLGYMWLDRRSDAGGFEASCVVANAEDS